MNRVEFEKMLTGMLERGEVPEDPLRRHLVERYREHRLGLQATMEKAQALKMQLEVANTTAMQLKGALSSYFEDLLGSYGVEPGGENVVSGKGQGNGVEVPRKPGDRQESSA